ncbi:DHH family phosphoesterase [Selenomonadales bacterium OttesenSCG-928-I06]|nr:DHH family phosphoesterase [Selenomonadales bacterium OttesenSCG-928-I06]
MPTKTSFWKDSWVILTIMTLLVVIVCCYNPYLIVPGLILLYITYRYSFICFLARERKFNNYLSSMADHINKITNNTLQNLPAAVVIINKEGLIYWRNSKVCEWLDDSLDYGKSFFDFFPEIHMTKMVNKVWKTKNSGQLNLKRNNRYFHVIYKFIKNDFDTNFAESIDAKNQEQDDHLMVLYIDDVTEFETTRIELHNARPVVLYILIDNYDDALQGLDEDQRTLILAEVNKRMSEWVAGLDGFLKKSSEEMYLAIIARKALEELISQEKFDVLDKVRAIKDGNKLPLTLSMGAATGPHSISELGRSARSGLDLALSRGGDQIAIDIDDKLHFYGGKAKATEKNTRVRARIVAHTIRELIDQSDSVMIMGHPDEDLDSLGAAMGVARMVMHAGKSVHIAISKSNISISKLIELFPGYADYQEMLVTPETAESMVNSRTLLFVVDTHRPDLLAAPQLLNLTQRIVVIDHHRRSEKFVDQPLLVYLEPSASSTSELITELLPYYSDKIELTQLEATALYSGILLDTKNFTVQTGVRTFEAVAYLRRAGADPNIVRSFFKLDFETVKERSRIITNAEMPFDGILISVCPSDVKDPVVIVAQAADMLLATEGIKATFVLFQAEDRVLVSARSGGDINVQVVMEKLGGGGHQLVAGAQIPDTTASKVREEIIMLIAKYIQESESDESNT